MLNTHFISTNTHRQASPCSQMESCLCPHYNHYGNLQYASGLQVFRNILSLYGSVSTIVTNMTEHQVLNLRVKTANEEKTATYYDFDFVSVPVALNANYLLRCFISHSPTPLCDACKPCINSRTHRSRLCSARRRIYVNHSFCDITKKRSTLKHTCLQKWRISRNIPSEYLVFYTN